MSDFVISLTEKLMIQKIKIPNPVPEPEPDGDTLGQKDSKTELTDAEDAAAEEEKRVAFSDYGISFY